MSAVAAVEFVFIVCLFLVALSSVAAWLLWVSANLELLDSHDDAWGTALDMDDRERAAFAHLQYLRRQRGVWLSEREQRTVAAAQEKEGES